MSRLHCLAERIAESPALTKPTRAPAFLGGTHLSDGPILIVHMIKIRWRYPSNPSILMEGDASENANVKNVEPRPLLGENCMPAAGARNTLSV